MGGEKIVCKRCVVAGDERGVVGDGDLEGGGKGAACAVSDADGDGEGGCIAIQRGAFAEAEVRSGEEDAAIGIVEEGEGEDFVGVRIRGAQLADQTAAEGGFGDGYGWGSDGQRLIVEQKGTWSGHWNLWE